MKNWIIAQVALLFTLLVGSFNFGRFSTEFRGTGTDWMMLVFYIIILICSLIALVTADLVRAKAARNSK
jgi:hypothetical protein